MPDPDKELPAGDQTEQQGGWYGGFDQACIDFRRTYNDISGHISSTSEIAERWRVKSSDIRNIRDEWRRY